MPPKTPLDFSIAPDAKQHIHDLMERRWRDPIFAIVINGHGGLHIIRVGSIYEAARDWNQNGMPVEMTGKAFCGTLGGQSYWTNWREYAQVHDLCKKCLKSWVRYCGIESDPEAKAQLQNLFPDDETEANP